jgi:glutamyl-tRNA synthetase
MLDFGLQLDKMTISGPLFDEQKLKWVNNFYLSAISTEELFRQTLEWTQRFQPDFAALLLSDVEYAKAAMDIERHTEKDPKRFTLYSDVMNQILFFFDSEWEKGRDARFELTPLSSASPLTGGQNKGISEFVREYCEVMDLETDDVLVWFEQLKEI